jgi:hypothetical protein
LLDIDRIKVKEQQRLAITASLIRVQHSQKRAFLPRINHWLKMHAVLSKELVFEPIFELNEVTHQPISTNFDLVVIVHLFDIHNLRLQLNNGLLLRYQRLHFRVSLTDEDGYAIAFEDEDLVLVGEAVHDVLKWSRDVGSLEMQLRVSAVVLWNFNDYDVLVCGIDGAFDELRVFLFLVEIDLRIRADGILEGAVDVQNLKAEINGLLQDVPLQITNFISVWEGS